MASPSMSPAFEQSMQQQQERSRATATFTQGQDEQALTELLKRVGPTEFHRLPGHYWQQQGGWAHRGWSRG